MASKPCEELRIVLVGKTGAGKTSTMNTLMGRSVEMAASASSRTTECQMETGEFGGQQLVVVDTPGVFNTKISEDKLRREIMKCMIHAAPGPHVLLYVMKLGPLRNEDYAAKKIIQEIFGKESQQYTWLLYTRGKIPERDDHKKFREEFGQRFFSIDNKQSPTPDNNQVSQLLEKINDEVQARGSHYMTNERFKKVQKVLEEEKTRQGITPDKPATPDELECLVDAVLELTMEEPLKTTVKTVLQEVEQVANKCATQ